MVIIVLVSCNAVVEISLHFFINTKIIKMTINLESLKEVSNIIKEIDSNVDSYKTNSILYNSYVTIKRNHISTIEFIIDILKLSTNNKQIIINKEFNEKILKLLKDLKDFVKFVKTFTEDDKEFIE